MTDPHSPRSRPLYETLDASGKLWLRTFNQAEAQRRADQIGGVWRSVPSPHAPAEPSTPDTAHEIHAVLDEQGAPAGWVWREHDGHEHWLMETVDGYRSPFGYASQEAATAALHAITR